jgi:biopolymer transport protein ExbD
MFLRDDHPIDEDGMNLTSMTDLVFLLLIFFLCATTFLDPERALQLELPEAAHAAEREDVADEIVISVLRDGSLSLGGRSIDRNALTAELARAARRDPATPVTIRGDRLVHHEDVVAVMDACGAAGLFNLAVGTIEGS